MFYVPEGWAQWAKDRRLGLQTNSYFEYKRLLEQTIENNHKQAARIMELELTIQQLRRKVGLSSLKKSQWV
jgi:hypothetical protein